MAISFNITEENVADGELHHVAPEPGRQRRRSACRRPDLRRDDRRPHIQSPPVVTARGAQAPYLPREGSEVFAGPSPLCRTYGPTASSPSRPDRAHRRDMRRTRRGARHCWPSQAVKAGPNASAPASRRWRPFVIFIPTLGQIRTFVAENQDTPHDIKLSAL